MLETAAAIRGPAGKFHSILTGEGDDSGRKNHKREDTIGVHGKEDGGPPLGLPANPLAQTSSLGRSLLSLSACDRILRNAGWTMKRFHGTTTHNKASDCAYIIAFGRQM
jgi:hypothetical protein